MAYIIELTQRAERDIEAAFEYINVDSPLNAIRWRNGLESKINTLSQLAHVFALAPENRDSRIEVRQLI